MRTRTCLIALLATGSVVLAGCGGSSGGSRASVASGTPAARAAITHTYEEVFSSSTPPQVGASLIQDGASLGKALQIATRLRGSSTQKAVVKKVTFTGPTTATVAYALYLNGSPVLPNATGQAVLVNGRWLMAKQTFCTLVSLGVKSGKVPGCE